MKILWARLLAVLELELVDLVEAVVATDAEEVDIPSFFATIDDGAAPAAAVAMVLRWWY